MLTVPLMTEGLVLRPFEIEDAEKAFENWMSDPDVTEFLTWETHRNADESRRIIRSWIQMYRNDSMDWCITSKPDLEPIGSITAVRDLPDLKYCEIGYCISKRYWNRGLMTEAIRAVTEYIFSSTDYLWVQARYDAENASSGRCLEKCGYRTAGEMLLPCGKRGGELRPYILMRIDRGDIMR